MLYSQTFHKVEYRLRLRFSRFDRDIDRQTDRQILGSVSRFKSDNEVELYVYRAAF